FFQAEDGIRDRNVTGVQTCALPILSSHTAGDLPRWCEGLRETRQTELPVWVQQAPALEGQKSDEGCGLRAEQQVHRELDAVSGRSEERRVGKEREWREATSQKKTKR